MSESIKLGAEEDQSYENGLSENNSEDSQDFDIDPENAFRVKTFVINEDGNWADMGTGTIVHDLEKTFTVYRKKTEPLERDFISPERERKLRGQEDKLYEDKGELILKVPIAGGSQFKQTQSTNKPILTPRDHNQLATGGHRGDRVHQLPERAGLSLHLEADLRDRGDPPVRGRGRRAALQR